MHLDLLIFVLSSYADNRKKTLKSVVVLQRLWGDKCNNKIFEKEVKKLIVRELKVYKNKSKLDPYIFKLMFDLNRLKVTNEDGMVPRNDFSLLCDILGRHHEDSSVETSTVSKLMLEVSLLLSDKRRIGWSLVKRTTLPIPVEYSSHRVEYVTHCILKPFLSYVNGNTQSNLTSNFLTTFSNILYDMEPIIILDKIMVELDLKKNKKFAILNFTVETVLISHTVKYEDWVLTKK